jgi:hypothetical protein
MKILLWIVGTLLGLVIALGIVQTVASERVEVIELHTLDETGEMKTTRLWIVDDEGFQYLRGEESSGWFTRLSASGNFEMTRGEQTGKYTYQLRPDKVARINSLMKEKYTWGDTFFETMLGSREQSHAIELHPATQ